MNQRLRVAVALGLLVSAVVGVIALRAAATGTQRVAPNTLDLRKEARFERGEANRQGPASPASEQVEDPRLAAELRRRPSRSGLA